VAIGDIGKLHGLGVNILLYRIYLELRIQIKLKTSINNLM